MKRTVPALLLCALALRHTPFASAQTQTVPDNASPTLPATFVTATDLLFADGMADPRGGTYHAIKVRVGNVWNGGGDVITTHGWVLPSSGNADRKRAVAWNGLTYDVVEDAGPADLKADIDRLLSVDDGVDTAKAGNSAKRPFRALGADNSEAYSLDDETLRPLKACLLLRTGEGGLAARVYDACVNGKSPMARMRTESQKEPFDRLAGDWTWAAFDRAVCAHMRGDDRVALEDARLLSVVGPKLEAQAKERGIRQPHDISNNPKPYFDFLQPVPELLADSKRRVAAPPEARLGETDLQQIKRTHPNTSERIAFLIRHLDDVDARQWGQPGGVGLDASLISEAIIREGEPAVDPLLNTMESDNRLTRSVSFGRDFFRARNLLTVRSAAGACVVRILHTGLFDANGTYSVAAIRAYWNANRGVPLVERWYRTLANDAASTHQWLEAAENIVQPSDVEVHGDWVAVPNRTPDSSSPPMRGESLRTGHIPTVSALLIHRVDEIAGAGPLPISRNPEFMAHPSYDAEAISLGLTLAEWDLKTSRPTLKLLMHRMLAIRPDKEATGDFDQIGGRAARLTIARIEAGDPEAASDYATYLHNIPPPQYGFGMQNTLSALYVFPNDPALARVSDMIFNSPDSAWNPLIAPTGSDDREPTDRESLIHSPLLCVPAFRRLVVRGLDDQHQDCMVTLDTPNNEIKIRTNKGASGYGVEKIDEPVTIPDGQPFPIRLCDMYAFQLMRVSPPYGEAFGLPRFELYWPQSRRDEVIRALKAYLLRFGPYFVLQNNSAPLHAFYGLDQLALRLPPLNHAATADDVRAGRAIFSLGNPQARQVRLPQALPVHALRLTTRDAHEIEQVRQVLERKIKWEPGKPLPGVEGAIYQVEEVPEGGKWRRYYGFVSQHAMERVSADEVFLVGSDGKLLPSETARL